MNVIESIEQELDDYNNMHPLDFYEKYIDSNYKIRFINDYYFADKDAYESLEEFLQVNYYDKYDELENFDGISDSIYEYMCNNYWMDVYVNKQYWYIYAEILLGSWIRLELNSRWNSATITYEWKNYNFNSYYETLYNIYNLQTYV